MGIPVGGLNRGWPYFEASLIVCRRPTALCDRGVCESRLFPSETELRYHDEVEGDLFHQVKNTLDLLLTKYLKAVISYEGIVRVETYPVPRAAQQACPSQCCGTSPMT
jgi:ATP-dependent DNA helicase RecG